jgi:hypothetical protein
MLTIAETAPFQRKISRLLSCNELSDLIAYLSEHPNSGVLIQGTGELRWARQGGGKSGGIRVIYHFHNESMPLYLLAAFGKNEKANLSTEEKQLLAKMVKQLVAFWRQRHEQSIH